MIFQRTDDIQTKDSEFTLIIRMDEFVTFEGDTHFLDLARKKANRTAPNSFVNWIKFYSLCLFMCYI